MLVQLIGKEGLERAAHDVLVWRKRRQTVLNAQSKGYDVKRASFLANLAHLQYFDQHWNSAKPGGNQSLHPDEFSLPLQFATGYAAVKYGLPEGVGRVKPAGPQHDFDWEFEGTTARVRHGVVYNSGTDTTGMFFTNTKRRWVVLAIRGSTTRTDTITNFSFDKVAFECPLVGVDGCKVHRGFYTGYRSIAAGVVRTTKRLFEKGHYDTLYVTGHSLGGAVAQLAVVDLFSRLGRDSSNPIVENMECFTFGSPKVGNRRFASFVDAQLPRVFRHVNDEDAIVSLPPAWAGFQHAGMLVHMNSNGIWVGKGTRSTIGVEEDGFALSETASDHWMRGYKYMLREFRQALYVPDETTVSLAHAWQVYLNSRESVREMAVVEKRDPATGEDVGPASFVRLNPVSVPDRGLLVAALNRAFGVGLYQVEYVS